MNPASLPPIVQGSLPAALALAAAALSALWPASRIPPLDRWLNHRAVPWIAGLISALVIRNIWGGLDAVPTIHDEAAYLLQAAMLSTGHLAGPARPLPEFFEQFHVFVTPVLAARYPPGFALVLVPGIWFGLPGLMPVLLGGLTGALLFALARRIATPTVALLAWTLWVIAPGNLRFRPTYLTESLSGFLWLATWWSLLEWRQSGKRGWLLLISALVGWQAITRPLTAVAFALPIGIVVLLTLRKTGRWRDLIPATAIGLLWLSVIPYQNQLVTGNWRLTPLKHYSEIYFPFDLPGFGYDSTPPVRAWPVDFVAFAQHFGPMHKEFTPDRLPGIFVRRSGQVLHDAWGRWWPSFALFALLGAIIGGTALRFGLLTCLSLVTLYLTFAHAENWTVYYLETEPALVAVVVIGIGWATGWLLRGRRETNPTDVSQRVAIALVALTGVVLSSWTGVIREARGSTRYISFDQERFRRQVARLPGPSIVFIHYGPEHDVNKSLIANEADLDRAHAWLVYDRGTDNRRLMNLAPARRSYLYEEERHRFSRLGADGVSIVTAAATDSGAAR